jgi:hypothetical protein
LTSRCTIKSSWIRSTQTNNISIEANGSSLDLYKLFKIKNILIINIIILLN